MEETLAFPRMKAPNLIISLEKISFSIPNRVLKIEGYILKNHEEPLEIIIFKGFSSSTTHPIEIDFEKKVLDLKYKLTKFKLYEAPLTDKNNNFIVESHNPFFFLNEKNWN